ncbi:MAG TPA: beta-ketoacyl synthase N-terminal-like domain-containing protein [Polyangiaceae bacterium]|nr:beta-ketoacyl synthase N-terminal-like domain-containing protein [Polyangiaceae bacterium]
MAALEALLASGRSSLKTGGSESLGSGLFATGDPEFDLSDYEAWIAARHGDAYLARMRSKMGDNVQFAVGATIQALQCDERLEPLLRELDDACHIYVGAGVGDLPESYRANASLVRAQHVWKHFWAQPPRCAARRRFEAERTLPPGEAPPLDPSGLPVDSEERADVLHVWDAYWAARSDDLRVFLERFAAIEAMDADDEDSEKAHLNAIRKRVRAHRALVDEVGCPPPPWTAVSPNLIWNIQNAPAAQITMLLDVHGAAWAPVGACSTFGVALKVGRDAILRGEAKMAVVGTTDPRPDGALIGAFHSARVMPGIGAVNMPFTSLRGTHVSGGSCVWILGDAEWCEGRGLEPVGGYVEAVALSSDAEHIITPSQSGPKRAMSRAYAEAKIAPSEVAVIDLHATGTPGDLNELTLVGDYIGATTRITARKGQLGHGMANSGGWELTSLALGLRRGVALPTGIPAAQLHPRIPHPEAIVSDEAPLAGDVGVKLMLGIGGLTACVVLRAS